MAMASDTAASKKTAKALQILDPSAISNDHVLTPHPVTGRLIDSHPGKRTKPMRVLCLGHSRTGTVSTYTALNQLGYKCYHMTEAVRNSPRTGLALWTEAMRAKASDDGKQWGRAEFDKILGDYDAVADVPCACFVEELVAAYPEAKVVLTNRDIEGWLQSMNNTAGAIFRWRTWSLVAPWDPALVGPFWEHAQVVMPLHFRTMNDFHSPQTPARQAFFDHYALVRKIVPKDDLLEFRVQEGWQPLCEFIGQPVPNTDFPNTNDANDFVLIHSMMWWIAFGKMVGKISLMAAVPVAGVAAAVWWRGKGPRLW